MLNTLRLSEKLLLDRLMRKAGAVVGTELDCLTTVAERRTLSRLLTILDNDHHTVLSTDRGAHSVADSCHCHAHRSG